MDLPLRLNFPLNNPPTHFFFFLDITSCIHPYLNRNFLPPTQPLAMTGSAYLSFWGLCLFQISSFKKIKIAFWCWKNWRDLRYWFKYCLSEGISFILEKLLCTGWERQDSSSQRWSEESGFPLWSWSHRQGHQYAAGKTLSNSLFLPSFSKPTFLSIN